MMKSDADVKHDVNDERTWDPSIREADVQTLVLNGIVTLRRTVGSYYEKEQAGRAAWRVAGVRSVVNELAIEPAAVSKRTDAEIAEAVGRALAWTASVPGDRVRYEVIDGWVTLRGELPWYYQKRAAEEAVRALVAVMGVSNLITLSRHPTAVDVKQRIERALARNAATDAGKIRVETHDGTVTLRGSVRSVAEREEAERAAWAAPGIVDVVDEIVITY